MFPETHAHLDDLIDVEISKEDAPWRRKRAATMVSEGKSGRGDMKVKIIPKKKSVPCEIAWSSGLELKTSKFCQTRL